MSILRTAVTVDGLESMKTVASQKVVAGTVVLKGNHIATFQQMAPVSEFPNSHR